ncbi:MAG: hypothetical protein P8X74_00330 [Reinekea sp.]
MAILIEKLSILLIQRKKSCDAVESALTDTRNEILSAEMTVNNYQEQVTRYRREYSVFLKQYEQPMLLNADERQKKELIANVIETKIVGAKEDLTTAKARLAELNKKHVDLQNLRKQIQVQINHIEKRCKALERDDTVEAESESVSVDDEADMKMVAALDAALESGFLNMQGVSRDDDKLAVVRQ